MEKMKKWTYGKQIFGFLNCFLPKFHNSPSNAKPLWKREHIQISAILHHRDELRLLDFIEWLITSDDPFDKKFLEPLLIPRQLQKSLVLLSNFIQDKTYKCCCLLLQKCFFNITCVFLKFFYI